MFIIIFLCACAAMESEGQIVAYEKPAAAVASETGLYQGLLPYAKVQEYESILATSHNFYARVDAIFTKQHQEYVAIHRKLERLISKYAYMHPASSYGFVQKISKGDFKVPLWNNLYFHLTQVLSQYDLPSVLDISLYKRSYVLKIVNLYVKYSRLLYKDKNYDASLSVNNFNLKYFLFNIPNYTKLEYLAKYDDTLLANIILHKEIANILLTHSQSFFSWHTSWLQQQIQQSPKLPFQDVLVKHPVSILKQIFSTIDLLNQDYPMWPYEDYYYDNIVINRLSLVTPLVIEIRNILMQRQFENIKYLAGITAKAPITPPNFVYLKHELTCLHQEYQAYIKFSTT